MSDQLDRAIRERLREYDAGTPTHLWAGIVEGRKPRRRALVWWNWKVLAAGLILVAAIGVTGYQVWQSGDSVVQSPDAGLSGEMPTSSPEAPSTPLLANKAEESYTTVGTTDPRSLVSPAQEGKSSSIADPVGDVPQSASPISAATTIGTEQTDGIGPAADSFTEAEKPVGSSEMMRATEASKKITTLELEVASAPSAEGAVPGKCVDFRDPNWNTYLDLYFSPDYAIRTLRPRSPASAGYAQLRSEESFQFAFTSGFRFNLVSPRGFGIRVGLQYAQIHEIFSHVDPDAVQENIVNNYDPVTGDLISSDTTIVYGTAIKKINNFYRMVDVPILVGYEWDMQRLTFSAYGGVVANLWFGQKGQFFAPNTEDIVAFNSAEPGTYQAFREHLSVHFAGAFGLQYQVGPDSYLLLEPHFRYFPSGITTADYPLRQRYFVSGIALGLRFRL